MKIVPTTLFGEHEHFESFTYREGACVRWSGYVNPGGYAQYKDPVTGAKVLAHRWIYTKMVGPIPYGLVIDHVFERGCRYRDCVRVGHLEAVSTRENGQRTSRAQTHCKHGHEYTDENTYLSTNKLGYTERHCKICRRGNQARYRARKKMAS